MTTDNVKFKFDPKLSYEQHLETMRRNFDRSWSQIKPSPQNNLEDYEVLGILGQGAFGKVKFVKSRETSNYFAAKQLLKEDIVLQKQVKHVFSEKQVLQSVDFPFLIGLEFSSKDNDHLYMGLTYCSGGELFNYLKKLRKFPESTARFYAIQVFLAFEYLHYMKILYRDLKPENILITEIGFIKVADFGMAKRVENRTYTLCGTPEYFAPEIIQTRPYGVSVDWWTFGVLIYELMTGHTPFFHNNSMELYERIIRCTYRMPPFFSPALKDLMTNILQVEISRRFGCMANGSKDIKFHDWFRGVDWYAYLNHQAVPPYVPTLSNLEDLSHFDHIPDKSKRPKSKANKHAEVFAEF